MPENNSFEAFERLKDLRQAAITKWVCGDQTNCTVKGGQITISGNTFWCSGLSARISAIHYATPDTTECRASIVGLAFSQTDSVAVKEVD